LDKSYVLVCFAFDFLRLRNINTTHIEAQQQLKNLSPLAKLKFFNRYAWTSLLRMLPTTASFTLWLQIVLQMARRQHQHADTYTKSHAHWIAWQHSFHTTCWEKSVMNCWQHVAKPCHATFIATIGRHEMREKER